MFGLKHILDPVSIDEFLADYAGRKAVHIHGPEDKFENLYSWAEVNNVLNGMRPSYEGVRLVHDTETLGQHEFRRLNHWLSRGATLVINHVQHIDPIAEQFAESLANDMNSSVNINGYVSFPSRQGFKCHYDTHDVFVVQTAGEKEWKVFEPTRTFPLDRDPADEKDKYARPTEGEYLSCILTPGDVLYIPRGHWHYAMSTESCIHLTVSYSNRSALDFLVWLLNEMRDRDEFLRQDLPLCQTRCLLGDRPDDPLEERLEQFRRHMHELIDRPDLAEKIIHWAQMENPLRQTFQLPELAELDRNPVARGAVFKVPANQKFITRHDPESGDIQLLARGRGVLLHHVPTELIELMLGAANGFSGDELMSACPDVSWDNTQKMLQSLFVNGLIVMHDRSA